MDPREPVSTSPDAARARLVTQLRARGGGLSRTVQDAFARVPRHIFVPEVGAAAAYRDEALVIKCGPDGLPVSSSSQPAMMAIMLAQLDLRRGHRVLEIGTGSGYNAAVMAEVVGTGGQVVSIDIDPELVARAQSSLIEAGYFDVSVLCADGGYGAPGDAPFDRVIVTAGAWDIAPAWLEQLGPGGRLVLPLSLRGMQLSVALERSGEEWVSRSAWRCGFVPMLGAFAGPERVFRLDEPQSLFAQMSDGSPVDGPALRRALTGPVTNVAVPAFVGLGEIADLDLWLTLTSRVLARLTVLAAPGGWLPLAPLLPVGGLIGHPTDPDRLGIAMLLPTETAGDGLAGPPRPPRVSFSGFGPGGATIAAWLTDHTVEWARLGRPGAHELELAVRPIGAGLEQAAPDSYVLRRPSVTIQAGWPGRAGLARWPD